MTDLVKMYCDVILKKIVTKTQRDQKAKTRAEERRLENSLDWKSVRTQRHWKVAADSEFYYNEMVKGYRQMKELDRLTSWSDNLQQDRFKFMEKYEEVLEEYIGYYKDSK